MTDKVVDLNEIVQQWALSRFNKSRSSAQKSIKDEDVVVNVKWDGVKFHHSEPKYQNVRKPPKPKSNVLFRTYFSNNTNKEQEYSFQTQRETKTSCEVSIEQGICRDFNLGLTLKCPGDILEVGGGMSRSVEVRNIHGETVEQTMTWGVDSQIRVRPYTRTTAELKISEEEYQCKFEVETRISGRVRVSLTNARDNNSLITTMAGGIEQVFRDLLNKPGYQFNAETKELVVRYTGSCHFRYGMEQHVDLTEEKLPNYEKLIAENPE